VGFQHLHYRGVKEVQSLIPDPEFRDVLLWLLLLITV
jgi:hypothetical protein